jgi:hypothetical protein
MSEYPTSFMMKLLMLCVPVPSRVLHRQPLDVSHPLPNMIACRVCYEDENICEIDEYQRAICSNCIVKMSRIDTCLRCDKTICSEHPLILDSQQMCNMCVCADACTSVSSDSTQEYRSTILNELVNLIRMMRGELSVGQSVTLRPRDIISQWMEEEFFLRNGRDFNIVFGARGTVMSYSPSDVNDNSLLSNGTYAVRLATGQIVHVPSASGLRYDGQNIELRLSLT